MINARIMLPRGELAFRDYIGKCKTNPLLPRPNLNSLPYSEEFSHRTMIEEAPQFGSKMEMAEYLSAVFDGAHVNWKDAIKEKGLWTWIAYLWFNQLTNNLENVLQREEYYIATSPTNYRRFYIHLVRAPYILYSYLGRDNSRIFNYNPVWNSNDFTERVAPNQFLISHQNIVEAIHKLYFDKTGPKIGASNAAKPGNIRRFIKVIQQFEITYDIYSMRAEQIINLLPSEFDQWR